MECVIEYKNINFRFDIIDFKFTYNYLEAYDLKLLCYDNGHLNKNLKTITHDMISSLKKQESKLIINKDNISNILHNFIIKSINIEFSSNPQMYPILSIEAAFDYLVIEEDYELKFRSRKIKNIINKMNNG